MFKRISLILILFSIFISASFSVGNNENYTDLYLEYEGWCSGLEITFKIWNETDWDNKFKIENDLCGEDENEEDDNCYEFHPVIANVTVFNGPINGLPILFEDEIGEDEEFKITFDEPNQYLIEIEPEDNYKSLDFTLLIDECPLSTNVSSIIEKLNETEIKNYNQTFKYTLGNIILENTKSNISNSFAIKNLNLKKSEIKEINNSISNFEIIGLNDFEKMIVEIPVSTSNNLSIFKYDSDFNKWNKISNFEIQNSTVIMTSPQFGVYSIVEEKSIEVPKEKKEIKTNMENLNNDNNIIDSKSSPYTLYIILFILFIVLIIGFKFINSSKEVSNYHDLNKKNDEKDNIKKELENSQNTQILTNYSDVYSKSKAYVKQYKTSFSKDKIYRALKQNNIPSDIIDKVFLEEY